MMIPPELKHIAVEKGAENTSFMDKLCSNQLCIVFQTSSYWVGHSIYGVFTYIHPLNYPNDGKYIYIYTLGIIFLKKNDGISVCFFWGHTNFEGYTP